MASEPKARPEEPPVPGPAVGCSRRAQLGEPVLRQVLIAARLIERQVSTRNSLRRTTAARRF
jgi:hypothetical protein